MAVLFYRPSNNQIAERLQNIIDTELPGEETEIYQSIEIFSERLRSPARCGCIAVLLADSASGLMEMLSIKELLKDIRIILVLPNRAIETVSTGYKLHPRFLSYADSDFKDVAAVLRKMIRLVEDSGPVAKQNNAVFN